MIKWTNEIRFHVCIAMLCFYGGVDSNKAISTTWLSKSRFQAGIEYDDNIRESPDHPIGKPSLRFLFQTNTEQRTPAYYIGMRYSGGYQAYMPSVQEDKLINDGSAQLMFHISPDVDIGFQVAARQKRFIHGSVNYTTFSSQLFFRFQLPEQFWLTIHVKKHLLNYRLYEVYDYQGLEFSSTIQKALTNHLRFELEVSSNNIHFDRNVYTPSSQYFVVHSTDNNQNDHLKQLSCHMTYSNVLFWIASYVYESNHSNSYGFSYTRQALVFNLSRKLPHHFLIRSYTMIQKKRYKESLTPVIPTELDAEKEDSNFIILDISRPISPRLTLFIRSSWYNNESPFRTLYYQKQSVISGIEYKF